jgi:hypothetical protein
MPRIRYIGSDETTTTFGRTFTRSQWVKNHGLSEEAFATLSQNPQFEVDGLEDAPEAAAPEPSPEPSFGPTFPDDPAPEPTPEPAPE